MEDGGGARAMYRRTLDRPNKATPYTRAWRATMRWAARFAAYWAAAVIGCILLHYACGLLVQTAVTGVPLRLIASASAGFLPGDLCKAALAATVAATFRR